MCDWSIVTINRRNGNNVLLSDNKIDNVGVDYYGVVGIAMIQIHIKIERWKWNETYGVWVSSEGRLRDKKKTIIRPQINVFGYMEYKGKVVHRIVMETFKPIEGQMTVDHLDHNKRNNSLDNLEWVTREENQERAEQDIVYCNPKDCMYIMRGNKLTLEELANKIGVGVNVVGKRMMKALKGSHRQIKYYGNVVRIVED